MATMTKKGARSVTTALDQIASLIQNDFKVLGIPEKIASDFALRCDMLSDQVERTAGINRQALSELDVNKEKGFDPEEIGQEQSGPLEGDSDEPYMKGHFTTQENRELREDYEAGDLGATPNLEPQKPSAGKQAMDSRLASACGRLQNAVAHLGGKGDLPKAVAKLAHAIMDVQMGIQTGQVSAYQASRSLKAVNHILPHLASVSDVSKVASMVALATKIVAEKEDDDEEEAPAASKKGGKIPPQFLENVKKKKEEAKGDDKEDDKEDKKEGGKKAHNFNLFA